MSAFGLNEKPIKKIIIVGGGNIGFNLAKDIEIHHSDISVCIIENSNERAKYIADQLGNTLVLNGDGLDQSILDEANIKMLNSSLKVYSEPPSLKIAKLFGQVNDLKIKGKHVYIRPKDLTIVNKSEIKAEVIQSNFVGQYFKITAKIGSKKITLFNEEDIKKNTQIHLHLEQGNILKFD